MVVELIEVKPLPYLVPARSTIQSVNPIFCMQRKEI
jgi:hypothetical protein